MTVPEPLVSILLPCFNAERFIDIAIRSLTTQTHRHLEIIALDDGSTDRTRELLELWARRDNRIRVLPADRNQGLITTLNVGLAAVSGDFIARMDADDIAGSTRIADQVAFLLANPDVDLVGTGIRLIDSSSGRELDPRPVRCIGPAGASFAGLFTTPVAHVTVLARTEVMKRYRYGVGPRSLHVEDYELWTRMLADGVRMANLPQQLVTVRADPAGVSLSNEELQVANFVHCAQEHLARMTGLNPRASVHRALVNRLDRSVSRDDLRQALWLLDCLASRAQSESPAATADIRRTAGLQRLDILSQALRRGSTPVTREAALLILRTVPSMTAAPIRNYAIAKLRVHLARFIERAT